MMKKVLIMAVAMATLSGCSVTRFTDAKTLTDAELCNKIGYAEKGFPSKAVEFKRELKRRLEGGLIQISRSDCNYEFDLGRAEAVEASQMADAMIAQYNNQQNQQRLTEAELAAAMPVTTTCTQSPLGFNSLGGSLTCRSN